MSYVLYAMLLSWNELEIENITKKTIRDGEKMQIIVIE